MVGWPAIGIAPSWCSKPRTSAWLHRSTHLPPANRPEGHRELFDALKPGFNPLGAMQHSMRVVAVEVSGEVAGLPVVCGTLHDGLVLGDGPRNLHGTKAYRNNARVRLMSPTGVRRHVASNRVQSVRLHRLPNDTDPDGRCYPAYPPGSRGSCRMHSVLPSLQREHQTRWPNSIQRAMDAGTDSVVFPLLDGDPACLDTSIRSLDCPTVLRAAAPAIGAPRVERRAAPTPRPRQPAGRRRPAQRHP